MKKQVNQSAARTAKAELDIRFSISMKTKATTKHRIYTVSFASVYPYYIKKAEAKGRTKSELDTIIRWLTGYTQRQFEGQLKKQKDFETFFRKHPN